MTSISSSPIVHNWSRLNDSPPPEPAAPPAPPAVEPSPNPLLEGSGPKHLPVNVYLAKMEYEQRLRTQALEKTQTPETPAIDTAPAQAVIQTQAVESAAPVVTKTPTADPLEIAALELLLADSAIQEVIQHFGGPRELPAGGNPVADSLNERYGALLVIQLNQLQVAQKEIQRQYLQEVRSAGITPYTKRLVENFDLEAFTSRWAAGERPVQRAWNTLYGHEIFRGSRHLPKLKYFRSALEFTPSFVLHGNTREHINPAHPPDKMIEPQLVWFDPQRGWLTDSSNFQPESNKFGKILSGIVGLAATYFTWGATAGYGAFVQGAATAAAGSAASQLTSTGSIRFKNLFQSALAGGITAGLLKTTGPSSASNSFSQRLIQHTGKATLQGAIQTALGGQFKDGVIHSLMNGVASEVGTLLHTEIAQTPNLSEPETSALRLLARATESALRIAANPQDKGYALASDFLGTLVGDYLEETTQTPQATENTDTPPAALPLNHNRGIHLGLEESDSWAYWGNNGELLIEAYALGSVFGTELEEIAARAVGATIGTAQSLGHIAASGARVLGNGLLQLGDILTGGYNHDHPVIQQAWSEQQAIGEALVRLMSNPREATSHAIEQIVKRYQAAKSIPDPYEQSRALGQLYSDVGQAAVGLGHATVTLSKAGVVGIEVALSGPVAGSRTAQRGVLYISLEEQRLAELSRKITEWRQTPTSPALKYDPYHPDVVAARIRPSYEPNPAHNPKSHLYNPKKSPEPKDAAQLYRGAILGNLGTWYAKNSKGQIYRYFSDNAKTVHFSGVITEVNDIPLHVLKHFGVKP